MKRYIVMLMIVLFCTYTMYANAEEGSVEVVVPVEEDVSFTYSKVASIENGNYVLEESYKESGVDLNQLGTAKEMEKAISKLQSYNAEKIPITADEKGTLKAMELEEGMYLIEGASNENYRIPAVLITVPAWSEELEEMSYEITVIPKIEPIPRTVETGDGSAVGVFSVFFVISLTIVVLLSCHKRFKCGRISE